MNGVQVPYGATAEELAHLVDGPIPARWAAFVALAHTPGEPALAVLGASAESSDPHVRRIAVEAISIHPEGNRLDAVLCRLLSDAHGAVVRSAIEAAAVKRVDSCHDSILRLIDAGEESTRVVSLRALRALWQEPDFDRVFRAFSSDASTDVRKQAAWTLRSNASRSTWRQLFEAWRADALPRHREWACELASTYGSNDVLADLHRLVNDTDGHIRERAAHAIRDLGTRGVTEGP